MNFKFIKKPLDAIRERIARNERERVIQEVNRQVQIREFDHKIYISYGGIPLLTGEELNDDICNIVDKIRDNIKTYKGL